MGQNPLPAGLSTVRENFVEGSFKKVKLILNNSATVVLINWYNYCH
jgi:hypothetical protein